MPRSDTFSLRESLPSSTSQADTERADDASSVEHADDASSIEQVSDREVESKRRRAAVLVGNAVLQLPIWGFATSYGVFQEYYTSSTALPGIGSTGIIGTTFNGVVYLSMPLFFSLFTKRWARHRQLAASLGALLVGLSFLLASFSTHVWHLILTQGVLAALGSSLVYSPTTLSLGEWFTTSNRAVAYGVVLSAKNVFGAACPFMFRGLLTRCGLAGTLRIWAGLAAGTSLLSILLVPTHPSSLAPGPQRSRRISWDFLRHRTIYIYSVAIMLQSAGYGIPQTYLNSYAHDVARVSQGAATLLLTLCFVPGIAASTFFGYLSDNRRFKLSTATVTAISSVTSALSAWLFWGLSKRGDVALLVLFALTYGFFASGYSATWGGVLRDLEREAARENEAVDAGMMYGLLNGARGIGYVSGGLASLPLLKAGGAASGTGLGFGSSYGPLIAFTGLSMAFGGWEILWKCGGLVRSTRSLLF